MCVGILTVCTLLMPLVLAEKRGGVRSPETGVKDSVSYKWMLETKPESLEEQPVCPSPSSHLSSLKFSNFILKVILRLAYKAAGFIDAFSCMSVFWFHFPLPSQMFFWCLNP